ncbi:hypothetical protein SH668x_002239 [Planctomicrobium sp. SH668]|uniref:hypothetical protein n=1 Tax=Planctomicrobium sp. SH668 TaxID=3448126 RepID=UPI003F5C3825
MIVTVRFASVLLALVATLSASSGISAAYSMQPDRSSAIRGFIKKELQQTRFVDEQQDQILASVAKLLQEEEISTSLLQISEDRFTYLLQTIEECRTTANGGLEELLKIPPSRLTLEVYVSSVRSSIRYCCLMPNFGAPSEEAVRQVDELSGLLRTRMLTQFPGIDQCENWSKYCEPKISQITQWQRFDISPILKTELPDDKYQQLKNQILPTDGVIADEQWSDLSESEKNKAIISGAPNRAVHELSDTITSWFSEEVPEAVLAQANTEAEDLVDPKHAKLVSQLQDERMQLTKEWRLEQLERVEDLVAEQRKRVEESAGLPVEKFQPGEERDPTGFRWLIVGNIVFILVIGLLAILRNRFRRSESLN